MKIANFLVLLLISFFNANAQRTEDIIASHIDSIGGLANWDKINTIEIKASVQMERSIMYINRKIIKNKALRNDISIENKFDYYKDKTFYIVLNENIGWKYLPETNHTILPLEPHEVLKTQDELDYEDPFIHYQEKGREISLIGIEYYNDEAYYKFLIKYKSDLKIFCYMNTKSLMIDKTVVLEQDYEDIRQYKNYTKLKEGIVMAKEVKHLALNYLIEDIKCNVAFSPLLFKPTEKKKFATYR